MKFVILIIFIFFISCTDPTEQQANKAFSEQKYLKAFTLYKKAIEKKPGKDVLYRNLEKTSAHIVAQGITEIQNKNYQASIDMLSVLVEDDKFPVGDARLASSIAHFHNREILNNQSSLENIQKGLYILSVAINESKNDFPTVNLTQSLAQWFVNEGLLSEDLLGNDFNPYDMSYIYRTLFFYDLADNIISNEKVSFPVPENWEKKDSDLLENTYKIFSWIIHNFNVCSEDNSYYYPASTANTLVRGYGTVQEQIKCFIFLCLQKGIPSYLLETKNEKQESQYYALCQIGAKWLTFDFVNKRPHSEKNVVYYNGEILNMPNQEKVVWLVFPSHSIIPRISKLNQVYNLLQVPAPNYHYNLYQMASYIFTKLGKEIENNNMNKLTSSEDFEIKLSNEEIKIWKYYTLEKDKVVDWKKREQLFPEETNMRIAQFVGDLETAEFFSINIENPKNQEFFDYYVATVTKNKKNYSDAKQKFETYIDKYPEGFWSKITLLQLAQIAIAEKDVKLANELYRKTLPEDSISFYISE